MNYQIVLENELKNFIGLFNNIEIDDNKLNAFILFSVLLPLFIEFIIENIRIEVEIRNEKK